jgi:phenylacetate-CoA ligase
LPRFVGLYNRFKPDVVIGYTSAMTEFAKYIKSKNIKCHRPNSVIATAEQLFSEQRQILENVFCCPVFNRYGSREVMLIASECEKHNGLHMNIDNLYIEILRNGKPANPGEMGEVVITDLFNYGMPFIRYQIGDYAVPSQSACTCGRGLPLLKEISGRTFDAIITLDGRKLTGLYFTHLMGNISGIEQFQIIQKRRDHLLVKIVKNNLYSESTTKQINEELTKIMGPKVTIEINFVDKIPFLDSGKRRITIKEFEPDN